MKGCKVMVKYEQLEGSAGTTVTVETARYSPKLVAWMEAMADYFNSQMGSAGDNYSYEEVFGHEQPGLNERH